MCKCFVNGVGLCIFCLALVLLIIATCGTQLKVRVNWSMMKVKIHSNMTTNEIINWTIQTYIRKLVGYLLKLLVQ